LRWSGTTFGNNATITSCWLGRKPIDELGTGRMAPYLRDMAAAFTADGFNGMISLENVCRPGVTRPGDEPRTGPAE
jgi:hypothetical protein